MIPSRQKLKTLLRNCTYLSHPTDEQLRHVDIFFNSYYKLKSVHSEFIYLFNRFHHDYNAKIRLGKKTCEQVLRTRDGGAGYTTGRDSKLSVPLRKIHKC